jgi:hypothetical protein
MSDRIIPLILGLARAIDPCAIMRRPQTIPYTKTFMAKSQ